ncbi:MAG: hypothetical protein HUJ26_08645 [Planctomycetaceae bacterium]|nr:hypothetical protein [Planctomycetaceae bacterium]
MSTANLDIRQTVLDIAKECAEKGPGFAQSGVVLREVLSRHGLNTLSEQQKILDAWYQLFDEKILVWGYNVDNPGPPFFHLGD